MGNTITYKKIFEVWKTKNVFQQSQLICLLRKAIFKVQKKTKNMKKIIDFPEIFLLTTQKNAKMRKKPRIIKKKSVSYGAALLFLYLFAEMDS